MSRVVLALAIVIVSVGFSEPIFANEPAEVAFINGRIFTADSEDRIVSAIAWKGERIVAVGSDDEIKMSCDGSTTIIDLKGKSVLPGLMDSHVHPHSAALHEFDHPIPDFGSIEDVLAYVKGRATLLPPGAWIQVRQVFITRLENPRYPTKAELDAAAPEHPVVFSTGPDAVLNSLALKLSGIDKDFQLTGTGTIERDRTTGEPTGLLRSCSRLIKSTPSEKSPSEEEKLERLQLLFADYNSVGITAVADRNAGFEDLARYQKLREAGTLSVRMRASVSLDNSLPQEKVVARLDEVAKHPLRADDLQLQIVGVKTFLDGGMLTGSAYMRQPWGVSAIYSISDPTYRGILFIQPENLEPMVRAAVERKLQFTAHSVGDGAIHSLLDAYEKVNRELSVRDTRPCLTHSNFMSAEAVDKMVELGVVADIQPAWLYLDSKVLTTQFGYERLRYFQPLKTIFEKGGVAGGGSDHMQKIGSMRSVNPYNPFLGMAVATERIGRWMESPTHAEESLTRLQALRFYTINNAYLMFLEKDAGSLEVGKLADLIVLEKDFLACSNQDLREMKVESTFLSGKNITKK